MLLEEVLCPRCSHVFDVRAGVRQAACPECHVELDLLSEDEAARYNDDVAPELLAEVDCPACDAPVLVAAGELEGTCPHCLAELEFEAEGDEQPEANPPESQPEPEQQAPEPGPQPEPAPGPVAEPAPTPPAFDPLLPVTPANAPLVHVRAAPAPLAPAEEAPAMEPLQADAPEPGPGPIGAHAAEVTNTIDADKPSPNPTPPASFEPTLKVTTRNAPLVHVRATVDRSPAEAVPAAQPLDVDHATVAGADVPASDARDHTLAATAPRTATTRSSREGILVAGLPLAFRLVNDAGDEVATPAGLVPEDDDWADLPAAFEEGENVPFTESAPELAPPTIEPLLAQSMVAPELDPDASELLEFDDLAELVALDGTPPQRIDDEPLAFEDITAPLDDGVTPAAVAEPEHAEDEPLLASETPRAGPFDSEPEDVAIDVIGTDGVEPGARLVLMSPYIPDRPGTEETPPPATRWFGTGDDLVEFEVLADAPNPSSISLTSDELMVADADEPVEDPAVFDFHTETALVGDGHDVDGLLAFEIVSEAPIGPPALAETTLPEPTAMAIASAAAPLVMLQAEEPSPSPLPAPSYSTVPADPPASVAEAPRKPDAEHATEAPQLDPFGDGIPVAAASKPVKRPEAAVLEACPACDETFRIHARAREGRCPHCGQYFAVENPDAADASEASPTPKKERRKATKADDAAKPKKKGSLGRRRTKTKEESPSKHTAEVEAVSEDESVDDLPSFTVADESKG